MRLANIKGTAEVLSTAADDDDDEEDVNEDDYEEVDNDNDKTKDDSEADDEAGDGEKADDNDDQSFAQSIMLKNIRSLNLGSSVGEIEFLELINSSCINSISNIHVELHQEVIPSNTFQQIWRTCNTNKHEYQASCQEKTKELINKLFDYLKQFQFE